VANLVMCAMIVLTKALLLLKAHLLLMALLSFAQLLASPKPGAALANVGRAGPESTLPRLMFVALLVAPVHLPLLLQFPLLLPLAVLQALLLLVLSILPALAVVSPHFMEVSSLGSGVDRLSPLSTLLWPPPSFLLTLLSVSTTCFTVTAFVLASLLACCGGEVSRCSW
jgi:hypothetical protein